MRHRHTLSGTHLLQERAIQGLSVLLQAAAATHRRASRCHLLPPYQSQGRWRRYQSKFDPGLQTIQVYIQVQVGAPEKKQIQPLNMKARQTNVGTVKRFYPPPAKIARAKRQKGSLSVALTETTPIANLRCPDYTTTNRSNLPSPYPLRTPQHFEFKSGSDC
jgi:hypothetical protein